MKLYEEIAKEAYILYEKSGYIGGRDLENWFDAERIVLIRQASQDIEEPEGEEPIIAEEAIQEEIEGKGLKYLNKKIEEEEAASEEVYVKEPALASKEDITIKTEKAGRPAKKPAAKRKKEAPKKRAQKKQGHITL